MKLKLVLQTFSLLFLSLVFIQCDEKRAEICDEKSYYAGIEISATSIKKTLLVADKDGKMSNLTETKTKQLNFSDDNSIDEGERTLIINELRREFEVIDRRCIDKKRIYIAFSSGLDNISGVSELQKEIVEKLGFPEENMEEINYHVETVSAMMTTDHGLSEEDVLFIDIGGSNTKLGVFDKSNNLYLSEMIKYGTRSLEEKIRTDLGKQPSYKEIEAKGKELLQVEIDNKLKSNAALNGKSAVLFVGGMPYNLVDNIYQNRTKRKLVTLTLNEKNNDLDNYGDAIKKDEIVIPEHLKYNKQELYTGHLIMKELYAASEITVAYYIDQVSWMSGFVEYKVKKK
ncbi:MAG: hypothetical protein ACPG19_12910 [Saprospiraceae bacterium]